MKEKQFDKWQKMRMKGKRRFILINGLLSWGVPMFVVMTFVVNMPENAEMTFGLIAINALIWTLGGLAFGYLTWTLSEKNYQKELKNRESA